MTEMGLSRRDGEGRISPLLLQERYLEDVLRYVSAFVRPETEAEDVTMEVFHAAFAALRKLRRDDDPRLWLLGIARRKVADSLRRSYRRREEPLSDIPHFDAHRQIENAALVRDVLAQLPDDQRTALVLKYMNELSTEEVAQVLGRTVTAANSLLQRSREAFYARAGGLFADETEVNQ